MKRFSLITILVAVVALSAAGCAMQSVSQTDIDGSTTKYTGLAFFNKAAIQGLTVGRKSKATSEVMGMKSGTAETQSEAITALAEAVGSLAGAAAKKAIIP